MATSLCVQQTRPAARSNYFRSLDLTVRKRYEENIALINDIDPYVHDNWTSSICDLPALIFPNIVSYFVCKKIAYTLEDFKAYKSLEAYNQFAFGWVREVKSTKINEYILIHGKVLHSMKVEQKPLEPWLILKEEGDILNAHCTCMAGLGEACTHVAAVLFYIEFSVRHRSKATVTGKPAYWMPPPTKEISFARMSDIDFSTPKRKCEALQKNAASSTACIKKPTAQGASFHSSSETFTKILRELHASGQKSAILSVIEPYCNSFVSDKDEKLRLCKLYKPEYSGLSREELVKKGRSMDLSLTVEEVKTIELNTRKQAKCKSWFKFRAGRITASKFKSACCVKSPVSAPSLVKAVCYPDKMNIKVKATDWGCQHEKAAIKLYTQRMEPSHEGFKVENVEFIINTKYPHFCASPDALVSCVCCGMGCLEIKCPYCIREASVEEKGNSLAYLSESASLLLLLHSHTYYYQVQAQIFISERLYCDFVVWTLTGEPHIERIYPDQEFWRKEAKRATIFFSRICDSITFGKILLPGSFA